MVASLLVFLTTYLANQLLLHFTEERKVFIGMIPKTFTNEDLLRMLEPHGTIEELNILKSADGKSKGMYVVDKGAGPYLQQYTLFLGVYRYSALFPMIFWLKNLRHCTSVD